MNTFIAILVCGTFAVASTVLHAQDRETVAVIGTGDMGDSLGPKLAGVGYTIVYGSRDPTRESVQALIKRTGEGATATTQEKAAQAAQIVLLAVPWPPMETIARNLGNLDGKVVVDLSFPYRQTEDGYVESMVETSSSEMIQAWNPGAKVVKAGLPGSFLIDNPQAMGQRPTAFIAGDDRAAKEKVAQMTFAIGLDPMDNGPLRNARYIEAMGMLYMVPLLQGRKEGWEFFVRRSTFWPCVANVANWFERPVADRDNLAEFPEPGTTPEPCSSYPPRP